MNNAKVILSTFFVEFEDGMINNDALFYLLSIGDVNNLETKRKGDQIKVKHPGISDFIYSVSYKNKIRGLMTNLKKTYLKNGVCVHTTTKDKLIHIKILNSSLGISGADSRDTVNEVTGYIINRLKRINNILNKIQTSPKTQNTLKWVQSNTKGEMVSIIKGTSYIVSQKDKIIEKNGNKYVLCKGCDDFLGLCREEDVLSYDIQKLRDHGIIDEPSNKYRLIRIENDNRMIMPKEYSNLRYPSNIDADVADFLINKIFECRLYSHFCMFMAGMLKISSIYSGDLTNYNIKTSMIVHNFYLNINAINLRALYMLPRSMFDDFIIIQNDDNTSAVKLQLEHIIPRELMSEIKIKRSKVHTIQIYRMGRITLSGPHESLNLIAINKFLNLIDKITHIIT